MTMVVDLFGFARGAQQQQGVAPLGQFLRLQQECLTGLAAVSWQAIGQPAGAIVRHEAGGQAAEQGYLVLKAAVKLVRRCGRCNQPVDLLLQAAARLAIYRTEAEADAVPLDEDEADPVVGSRQFDLLAQVEEELLLAIPGFFAHAHCPTALLDGFATTDRPNPFAALAALKKKN